MKEVREHIVLPEEVDLGEGALRDLVARLASRLAPGLERSVGPISWKTNGETGVDWTAEGFVDGAFVVLCLRPSLREVSLLVTTGLTQPIGNTPRWVISVLLAILGASVMVGATKRSLGWALLTLLTPLSLWIATDMVVQGLKRRRADTGFDGDAWRRRFADAVGAARRL